MTTQRSSYRGPTRPAAEAAFREDAQRAFTAGYLPLQQDWVTEPDGSVRLDVIYEQAAGGGAPSASTLGYGQKYCSACGTVLDARAEICPRCGVRQLGPYTTPSGRSKIIAGILALFVGGFGVHKFYLGKPGQGIVYLLFFWTVIPAIIAFFEALYYFFMSDAEFAARYG